MADANKHLPENVLETMHKQKDSRFAGEMQRYQRFGDPAKFEALELRLGLRPKINNALQAARGKAAGVIAVVALCAQRLGQHVAKPPAENFVEKLGDAQRAITAALDDEISELVEAAAADVEANGGSLGAALSLLMLATLNEQAEPESEPVEAEIEDNPADKPKKKKK